MAEQPDPGPCFLDTGDTAWVLTGAALVFIQTPGVGITQAGLIRRKNSLSMLMQAMSGAFIGSILWMIIGFSLTFGPDEGEMIGNGKYAFTVDIPETECIPELAANIPGSTFFIFQMMFAIMVPVIITGAWAEKLNFKAFLIFTTIWPFLVYYPLAHWVWGGGWLYNLGTIDFAGGITIHTNAGVASLVIALIMRRRPHLKDLQTSYHNIPLTIVGGTLIIVGWYGFNGASSLAADSIGSYAFMNTHIAMSTSAFTWGAIAFLSDQHFHLAEVLNGAFCGLACITPGSGFVTCYAAFCIGIMAGAAGFGSVWLLKGRLQLDDVLDVSSLQGTPGILGSFVVGFFATRRVNPGLENEGVFYGGNGNLLLYQMAGIGTAIAWSGFWTGILVLLMDLTIGIHISIEDQESGQDATEMGEQAYDESEGKKKKKKGRGGEYIERKDQGSQFFAHPVAPEHR